MVIMSRVGLVGIKGREMARAEMLQALRAIAGLQVLLDGRKPLKGKEEGTRFQRNILVYTGLKGEMRTTR